jgi:hypothetical protein
VAAWGASPSGIVPAMRNFAGLRLAATARYQASESRIAGSLHTQSWSKDAMARH